MKEVGLVHWVSISTYGT